MSWQEGQQDEEERKFINRNIEDQQQEQFLKYLLEYQDIMLPIEKTLKGEIFDPITGKFYRPVEKIFDRKRNCWVVKERPPLMNQTGINYLKSQIIPLITKHAKYGWLSEEENKRLTRQTGYTILENIIINLDVYEIKIENVKSVVHMACNLIHTALTMAKNGHLAHITRSQFHTLERYDTSQQQKKSAGSFLKFGRN